MSIHLDQGTGHYINQLNGADILIVDDTPENLRLLAAMLTNYGFQVRKAINGDMALLAVQTLQPDLILLDIMMPNIDGYEVCKRLKENEATADIPVIFLSALDDAFDKVKAFEIGGADYISKPFHMEEVLVRVRHQLVLQQMKREIQQLNNSLELRIKERTHQLEEAHQQLIQLALYDNLTGLANKLLFGEKIGDALTSVQSNSQTLFAVLFLDCDRFKIINDSLGPVIGDELLLAIANRLKSLLEPDSFLARFGGDEFAILLPGLSSEQAAIRLAENVLDQFTQPFSIRDNEIFITASIGIVIGHRHYLHAEHVLRDADTAMYRAKANGKGQWHLFDESMHTNALKLMHLETELRRAVQQDEFVLHYQPIVHLESGAISGFEALTRWQHPTRGLVPPNEFIPIAEETGLIIPIGIAILKHACQQMKGWQQMGIVSENCTISVNLSVHQFAQINLLEHIDCILEETKLAPQCLRLEITESTLISQAKTAIHALQSLVERDIQMSIDDFGTGYSSLSYLHSLPINQLKIDRSFVQRIGKNCKSAELIPIIISIAHKLGIRVVAEGIETELQHTYLKEQQCDYGQGYLFSQPLEAEHLVEFLNHFNNIETMTISGHI